MENFQFFHPGVGWEVPGGPGEDPARARQGASGKPRMRLNLNMIVTFFIFYLFILPSFLGDRHPQGEARPESERRQTGRFPCVCLNLAPTWGLNFGANFRISCAFF